MEVPILAQSNQALPPIIPRSKWWWLGLAFLMILAGSLYYRGYDVSLPYIDHVDEPHHLLAAQHLINDGSTRAVGHEAYPPGMSRLNYLLLKHVKPPDAHHGTMLPALRLITVTAWMLTVVVIALLGYLAAHPLTGLMAAAIWIVNPWVVERAHWALPDGFLTLFTLLSLWLALIAALHGRRSFSTAAVYSLMLAIVFKTTALFVAPIVLFLPLVGLRRKSFDRSNAWQQVFWNCVRFGVFLFWLLLIYPTLEAHQVYNFPVTESRITLPQLSVMRGYVIPVLLTFQSLTGWVGIVIAGALTWRYRQRVSGLTIMTASLAAFSWLLAFGILPVRGDQMRQFFGLGALLSILYAVALTNLLYAGQESVARLDRLVLPRKIMELVLPGALAILLAIGLLPAFRESDALAHDYSLPDRRNDLAVYMDSSLKPGSYVSNYENHNTFNRPWGGYDGVHDFP